MDPVEQEAVLELPGEANPLTENLLLHVLRSASSNASHQIQTGTKQLQRWETTPGYYSSLQAIFIDRLQPLEVRYLAIIQLKNGIDKYWRKTAQNAVSKDEKALIRSRLLKGSIDEPDTRLALQNALVVAKVVRFEYPNDWPDAIKQILDILQSSAPPDGNQLHLTRALLMFLYIIKELTTGRLMRTRSTLQTIASEIIDVLCSVYIAKVLRWQNSLRDGNHGNGFVHEIEQSVLAIRALRRLLVVGYEFANRDAGVERCWRLINHHFVDFLGITTNEYSPVSANVQQLVDKHLMQIAKLHVEMAQVHPAAFVLLPDSLSIVRTYWGLIARVGDTYGLRTLAIPLKIGTDGDAEDEETPILERLALKGLLLMRACLKMVFYPAQTFKYRHPEDKVEQAQAKDLIKAELLTEQTVRVMAETIVSRFFVFRATDLRQWETEPEEWERREEGGEEYEFTIRACSEKLFLDLIKNFKNVLIEPLLGVFYSVATLENENILQKDAVYTAIGLAADILHESIDFNGFVSSILVNEVVKTQLGYNIIRRRASIMIAQWISVGVSDANKPLVYHIFRSLLNKHDILNDQVVRVTAGRQFKNIADHWEFKFEHFAPFARDILNQLLELTMEVELSETKIALLNTIGSIIERSEVNITDYAMSIMNLLVPLWDQSGDDYLMKQTVVATLTRLANAMRSLGGPYHAFLLKTVISVVEPNSPTQVYLLDDALELWSTILVNSDAHLAPPELVYPLPYLIPLFAQGSDVLRKCLEITESYVLLYPADVLSDEFRIPLLRSLSYWIKDLKPEAARILTHLLIAIVRCAINCFEGQIAHAGIQRIVGDLLSTGLLDKLMEGLRGAWKMHHTHWPNRTTPEYYVDGQLETDYFSVLARIAFADPRALVAALTTISNEDADATVDWLLEEWFSHVEDIPDPADQKLMCFGLTRLMETGQPWILGKLQSLMSMWTTVVTHLQENMDDPNADCFDRSDPNDSSTLGVEIENAEQGRREVYLRTDPLYSVNLMEFIRVHLQEAIEAAGGELQFRELWLDRVDNDVIKAFLGLGIMGEGVNGMPADDQSGNVDKNM